MREDVVMITRPIHVCIAQLTIKPRLESKHKIDAPRYGYDATIFCQLLPDCAAVLIFIVSPDVLFCAATVSQT